MSGNRSVDDASVLVERTAGLTAAIGIFVLFSSVIFTITGNMGLHNVIAGAVIAFIASFHAFRSGEQHSPSAIIALVLILLGLWMVASPFVFEISRDLVIQINIVTGVLIVILSIASVYGSFRTSNTTAS